MELTNQTESDPLLFNSSDLEWLLSLQPSNQPTISYQSAKSNEPLNTKIKHASQPATYQLPIQTQILNQFKSNSREYKIKEFKCLFTDCKKVFKNSGHLNRHYNSHFEFKNVECEYSGCSKRFSRADNMRTHYKLHFKNAL